MKDELVINDLITNITFIRIFRTLENNFLILLLNFFFSSILL